VTGQPRFFFAGCVAGGPLGTLTVTQMVFKKQRPLAGLQIPISQGHSDAENFISGMEVMDLFVLHNLKLESQKKGGTFGPTPREDINDTRRGSYAGNQSNKLDPRNDLDNPRLLSLEEEQQVRNGRQKGKGNGKGKGWQYSSQQQQPQQQRSQGGKGGRGKPWRSSSRKPPEKSK